MANNDTTADTSTMPPIDTSGISDLTEKLEAKAQPTTLTTAAMPPINTKGLEDLIEQPKAKEQPAAPQPNMLKGTISKTVRAAGSVPVIGGALKESIKGATGLAEEAQHAPVEAISSVAAHIPSGLLQPLQDVMNISNRYSQELDKNPSLADTINHVMPGMQMISQTTKTINQLLGRKPNDPINVTEAIDNIPYLRHLAQQAPNAAGLGKLLGGMALPMGHMPMPAQLGRIGGGMAAGGLIGQGLGTIGAAGAQAQQGQLPNWGQSFVQGLPSGLTGLLLGGAHGATTHVADTLKANSDNLKAQREAAAQKQAQAVLDMANKKQAWKGQLAENQKKAIGKPPDDDNPPPPPGAPPAPKTLDEFKAERQAKKLPAKAIKRQPWQEKVKTEVTGKVVKQTEEKAPPAKTLAEFKAERKATKPEKLPAEKIKTPAQKMIEKHAVKTEPANSPYSRSETTFPNDVSGEEPAPPKPQKKLENIKKPAEPKEEPKKKLPAEEIKQPERDATQAAAKGIRKKLDAVRGEGEHKIVNKPGGYEVQDANNKVIYKARNKRVGDYPAGLQDFIDSTKKEAPTPEPQPELAKPAGTTQDEIDARNEHERATYPDAFKPVTSAGKNNRLGQTWMDRAQDYPSSQLQRNLDDIQKTVQEKARWEAKRRAIAADVDATNSLRSQDFRKNLVSERMKKLRDEYPAPNPTELSRNAAIRDVFQAELARRASRQAAGFAPDYPLEDIDKAKISNDPDELHNLIGTDDPAVAEAAMNRLEEITKPAEPTPKEEAPPEKPKKAPTERGKFKQKFYKDYHEDLKARMGETEYNKVKGDKILDSAIDDAANEEWASQQQSTIEATDEINKGSDPKTIKEKIGAAVKDFISEERGSIDWEYSPVGVASGLASKVADGLTSVAKRLKDEGELTPRIFSRILTTQYTHNIVDQYDPDFAYDRLRYKSTTDNIIKVQRATLKGHDQETQWKQAMRLSADDIRKSNDLGALTDEQKKAAIKVAEMRTEQAKATTKLLKQREAARGERTGLQTIIGQGRLDRVLRMDLMDLTGAGKVLKATDEIATPLARQAQSGISRSMFLGNYPAAGLHVAESVAANFTYDPVSAAQGLKRWATSAKAQEFGALFNKGQFEQMLEKNPEEMNKLARIADSVLNDPARKMFNNTEHGDEIRALIAGQLPERFKEMGTAVIAAERIGKTYPGGAEQFMQDFIDAGHLKDIPTERQGAYGKAINDLATDRLRLIMGGTEGPLVERNVFQRNNASWLYPWMRAKFQQAHMMNAYLDDFGQALANKDPAAIGKAVASTLFAHGMLIAVAGKEAEAQWIRDLLHKVDDKAATNFDNALELMRLTKYMGPYGKRVEHLQYSPAPLLSVTDNLPQATIENIKKTWAGLQKGDPGVIGSGVLTALALVGIDSVGDAMGSQRAWGEAKTLMQGIAGSMKGYAYQKGSIVTGFKDVKLGKSQDFDTDILKSMWNFNTPGTLNEIAKWQDDVAEAWKEKHNPDNAPITRTSLLKEAGVESKTSLLKEAGIEPKTSLLEAAGVR